MIDFESLLKIVEDSYASNVPFVAYREPNQKAVKVLIQSDDHLHLTNEYSESGFVFAPFNNEEKSVLMPLEGSSYEEANFEHIDLPSDDFSDEFMNEVEKQKHIDLINEGIRFIKTSNAKKVVLSRKEDVSVSHFSPIITFYKVIKCVSKCDGLYMVPSRKGFMVWSFARKIDHFERQTFSDCFIGGYATIWCD